MIVIRRCTSLPVPAARQSPSGSLRAGRGACRWRHAPAIVRPVNRVTGAEPACASDRQMTSSRRRSSDHGEPPAFCGAAWVAARIASVSASHRHRHGLVWRAAWLSSHWSTRQGVESRRVAASPRAVCGQRGASVSRSLASNGVVKGDDRSIKSCSEESQQLLSTSSGSSAHCFSRRASSGRPSSSKPLSSATRRRGRWLPVAPQDSPVWRYSRQSSSERRSLSPCGVGGRWQSWADVACPAPGVSSVAGGWRFHPSISGICRSISRRSRKQAARQRSSASGIVHHLDSGGPTAPAAVWRPSGLTGIVLSQQDMQHRSAPDRFCNWGQARLSSPPAWFKENTGDNLMQFLGAAPPAYADSGQCRSSLSILASKWRLMELSIIIWLCRASGKTESSSAGIRRPYPASAHPAGSAAMAGLRRPGRNASPALSTQIGISPIWRSMASSRRRLVLLSSTTSTRWLVEATQRALPETAAFEPSSGRVKANSLPAPAGSPPSTRRPSGRTGQAEMG